jgi:hypothetical protein
MPFIYYGVSHVSMLHSTEPRPSGLKKPDADEESGSDMLCEESSNEMSESETEGETSAVACWWVRRCDTWGNDATE